MTEHLYVYAIVPRCASLAPEAKGFGGPLHTEAWRDLAAVISDTEASDSPPPTPENLLRHEAVVESIRTGCAALPVRFGTVLANRDAVRRALADRYETLLRDLTQVGDKVELGVTALWRQALCPVPADTRTPPPPEHERRQGDPETDADALHPGKAYLLARVAVYRQAGAARERAERLAADLDSALLAHALDSRQSLCPAPRLALRNQYLAAPDQVRTFTQAFEAVRRDHQEVHILLSGPWPPYSFVTPPALNPPDATS